MYEEDDDDDVETVEMLGGWRQDDLSPSKLWPGHEERMEAWRVHHQAYLDAHPDEDGRPERRACTRGVEKILNLPVGVSQVGSRFQATVSEGGKSRYIGSYATVEEATSVSAAAREARDAERRPAKEAREAANRERDAKVIALSEQGESMSAIGRMLDLDHGLVSRIINAAIRDEVA